MAANAAEVAPTSSAALDGDDLFGKAEARQDDINPFAVPSPKLADRLGISHSDTQLNAQDGVVRAGWLWAVFELCVWLLRVADDSSLWYGGPSFLPWLTVRSMHIFLHFVPNILMACV